jgi:hypothetical protein
MTRYIGEYGDKFLNQLSLNGKPLTPEQKKEFVDKFSREFQTMLEPKKLATQK